MKINLTAREKAQPLWIDIFNRQAVVSLFRLVLDALGIIDNLAEVDAVIHYKLCKYLPRELANKEEKEDKNEAKGCISF